MASINTSNVVSALRMDTEICMNYGDFYVSALRWVEIFMRYCMLL